MKKKHPLFPLILPIFVCLTAFAIAEEPASQRPVSYFKDIRPIFQARCQGCHQPAKPEGGFVMTEVQRLRDAGDSGNAGVVPGKAGESHLLAQITPDVDGRAEMPKDGKPLTAAEIELVRRWIAEGAQDDSPATVGQKVDADHPPRYSRQPVVTSIDFSPDGKLLAVGGFHEVILFDVSDAAAVPSRPKMRLVGMSERIERVRFSPDGTRLAATGGDPARMGEVQIWNVAQGMLERSVPVSFDTVYGGTWSPDGRLIAFGCTDNSVRAIDATTGEQVLFQGAHEDWVLDTVFAPKGDHVISVGRDMTVKLTELATQRFVDNITSITPGALRGGLAAVDRHPTLDHVVAAGADGTPRIYRIHRHAKRVIGDDANHIFPLFPVSGRVFSVRFSQDGKRVAAVGGIDGRGQMVLCSYDLAADVPQNILDIMAKVPGETRTKGSQRSEAEWKALDDFRAASTKLLATIEIPEAMAYAVAFHPTSGEVAVSGGDGVVRLLGPDGAERRRFPVAAIEQAVAGSTGLRLPWPPEPSIEPEPAVPTGVASIAVEPREIVLAGPFAATQVVVSGTLADGRTIDLTRSVRIESPKRQSGDAASDGALVSVGPGGLVRPLADGSGSLRIVLGDGGQAADVPIRVEGTGGPAQVDFLRDVNPALTKMGCNQGTCHGAAKGKNGFKLSLRGYDALFDVRALTDDHGSRRVNLASPDDSLMLLKASATVPHTGGLLAKPDAPHYQIVRRWIEQGASLQSSTPKVTSIAVSPLAAVVDKPGRRQQFRVVASYADGAVRDVTREAFLESGNGEVATADPTGLVTAVRRGEAPILVRYEGAYAAVTLTVMGDREGFQWKQPETWGPIDELVATKWKGMQIEPAPLCSDDEFLRRVTLDLTGLPPTASDVRSFLADHRDTRIKRAELVSRLLGSEAFVEHWTNKWSDLLQVNPKFLAADGANGLRDWIRRHVAANTPHDVFAREILTAAGSNRENPAASYYKTLRDPLAIMENTTHLFLGVRFNCNKCHDHPFERWTQDQYFETAAFFAHVSLERDPESQARTIGGTAVEGAKPLFEIVKDQPSGEVTHERTGKPAEPRFPFECEHEVSKDATRREQLAAWITSARNPYFARSFVNRLWGHCFATGIIEPVDDIRAGNPPTNPALLEHLTRSFVDGGFDVRRVLREICTSRTYGLAITSNRWNDDDSINYSHAIPRRLPAETLYDALHTVVGTPTRFPGYPVGTRAASLPDVASSLGGGFLQTFGRPVRESACECERSAGVSLGPVMALVSGPEVGNVLAERSSELAKLVATQPDDAALVDEVFIRFLNRPSRADEVAAVRTMMDEIAVDHESLMAEVSAAEAKWAIERAAREEKRSNAILLARGRLAEAEATYEPKRQELLKQRADRIAAMMAALEKHLADPEAPLRRFEEAAMKAATWWVAMPKAVESRAKAETRVLEDGSVLVSGPLADDTTTFTAPLMLSKLSGIRLELLADASLPSRGPGRAPDGNVVINEISVEVYPTARPTEVRKVVLHRPQADFSQDNLGVNLAIDGDLNAGRGWAVSPRTGQDHWAVFECKERLEFYEPMEVRLRIEQKYPGGKHAMGRFRVSVSDSPGEILLGVPARGAELAAIPRGNRSPAEIELLARIAAARDPELRKLEADLASAISPLPADPMVTQRLAELADAEKPVIDDPAIVRLRSDAAASAGQLSEKRLTAIQDLAWALINSPAFFFNH